MSKELTQYVLLVLIVIVVIYLICNSDNKSGNSPENFQTIYTVEPYENYASEEEDETEHFGGTETSAPLDTLVDTRVSFGTDDAGFLAKQGSNVVGKSLIVDKLCFGDESSCIDQTLFDNLNMNERVNTYMNNTMQMYSSDPKDYTIYQNIFDAFKEGVARSSPSLSSFDNTSFTDKNPWNGRPMIRVGSGSQTDVPNTSYGNGGGMIVKVPDGTRALWVRVNADRWNIIKAYYNTKDGNGVYSDVIGNFISGNRKTNKISPDGGPADSFWQYHYWVHIPIAKNGEVVIASTNGATGDLFITGLAFTKNPWNHAFNGALAYHWNINGGSQIGFGSNNDTIGYIQSGRRSDLVVPIVYSGKDKMVYFVLQNDGWEGALHSALYVEGRQIERLMTTYDNAFARHFSTKTQSRYVAAKIPKEYLTPGKLFIRVSVDMFKQNNNLAFKELGTHDYITI